MLVIINQCCFKIKWWDKLKERLKNSGKLNDFPSRIVIF